MALRMDIEHFHHHRKFFWKVLIYTIFRKKLISILLNGTGIILSVFYHTCFNSEKNICLLRAGTRAPILLFMYIWYDIASHKMPCIHIIRNKYAGKKTLLNWVFIKLINIYSGFNIRQIPCNYVYYGLYFDLFPSKFTTTGSQLFQFMCLYNKLLVNSQFMLLYFTYS